MPVHAEQEGDFTYTIINGEAQITGYTGIGGNVTIPGQLGGKIVTSIGYSAFDPHNNGTDDMYMIKSIKVPNCVKTIESCAFGYNMGLEEVVLPESLIDIGDSLFIECSSLKNVQLPQNIKTVGLNMFQLCTSLENVEIPDSVESIGANAFGSCPSLKTLIIPKSVKSIGAYAFSCSTSLDNINIPEGVINIEHDTFMNCFSLTNITLPSSLTGIDNYAFSNCQALSEITIPNNISTIGDYAFDGCPLESIWFPKGLKTIGKYAFNNCDKLSKVIIPENVVSIGDGSFNIENLETIQFDSKTTKIGSDGVGSLITPMDTTIIGKTDSTAYEYAILYGYKFEYWQEPRKTKAIYVLPGFMGSELYRQSGLFWLEPDALKDDITGYVLNKWSLLDRESDGSAIYSLKADIQTDDYGTDDGYENLISGLRNNDHISYQYDVVFFPYNWLGDLNQSELALEQDIKDKGYEKVIFVTHSTGGLLAADYILKDDNAANVEKSVLIAAPLYGTYESYKTIVTGSHPAFENAIKDALPEPVRSLSGITAWMLSGWVKNTLKNSPTAYQLFPSDEYLSMFPVVFHDVNNTANQKTSAASVGQLKNKLSAINDPSLNYKLLNGNTWSHQYFRNTTLKGDVVDSLVNSGVDICLIGSSKCEMKTVKTVSYSSLGMGLIETDFFSNTYGDGTVPAKSAFGLKGDNKYRLKYADFINYGFDHGKLAKETDVIKYVVNEINSINGKNIDTGKDIEYKIIAKKDSVTTAETDTGMSDNIKYNIVSDLPFDVKVTDENNMIIASVINGVKTGFDGGQYDYNVLIAEENRNAASIYLPNSGLKVEFYSGTEAGVPINFKTDISTLNIDGDKTATTTYTASSTGESGLILSFDMLSKVDKNTIGSLVANRTEATVLKQTDWSVPEVTKMEIGEMKTIELSGTEADLVKPDLCWESSDPSIVDVSELGVLTAKGCGVATVTATDGNKVVASQVTVKCLPQAVDLSDIELFVGKRKTIKSVFSPEQTTEKNMTYQTADTNIIKIDEFNGITGLAEGTAMVTGTTDNGLTDTFAVTIKKEKPLLGIKLNLESLKITKGNVEQLIVNYDPIDTLDDKSVTWTSSDESVAIVDNVGNVTGVGDGQAVITATVGTLTASCNVNVSTLHLGDVDGNGKIQAYDALMALQIATGKKPGTEVERKAADVDNSGSVQAFDALRILQYATGKIVAF